MVNFEADSKGCLTHNYETMTINHRSEKYITTDKSIYQLSMKTLSQLSKRYDRKYQIWFKTMERTASC